jgi:hypothetical protein
MGLNFRLGPVPPTNAKEGLAGRLVKTIPNDPRWNATHDGRGRDALRDDGPVPDGDSRPGHIASQLGEADGQANFAFDGRPVRPDPHNRPYPW